MSYNRYHPLLIVISFMCFVFFISIYHHCPIAAQKTYAIVTVKLNDIMTVRLTFMDLNLVIEKKFLINR